MSDKYRFSVTCNAEKRIVIIRVTGPMPSAMVIDKFLETYRSLQAPWSYRRLIDYRRFEGLINYEDIERFSRSWADLICGNTTGSRVAVVTLDPLELARPSTVNHLFPNDVIRAFDSVDQALDWFDEP